MLQLCWSRAWNNLRSDDSTNIYFKILELPTSKVYYRISCSLSCPQNIVAPSKNCHFFCIFATLISNCLNPILHGGGHFVPAHVGDPLWFLGGCTIWAHNSWLCFIHHFIGPIEAIFQKKNWKFWKIKKNNFSVPTPKGPPFEKKSKNWKKKYFYKQNQTFYTWIWIPHVLSFVLRYVI